MQQFVNCFIEFIIANWKWLIPITLSVVEFFILLIFKKPDVVKFIDNFYGELIDLVNEAEELFPTVAGEIKKSKFKKDYVVSRFIKNHPYLPVFIITDAVERILSSPEKKKVFK